MKAIITVGISASGKTTWANEFISSQNDIWGNVNRDNIRFNIVCPGTNWGTYKFTKKREEDVTRYANTMIEEYASLGRNIIISDTNLNPVYRKRLEEKLVSLGYDVEYKMFHIELEEAYKRDQIRPNGVGRDVIYKQYQSYLDLIGEYKYSHIDGLRNCVICDIDGTIAKMRDRGPYEWDKVLSDLPRKEIIKMVDSVLGPNDVLIFMSGRDSVCRYDTLDWLLNNMTDKMINRSVYLYLHMRAEGDTRKDTIVKKELFMKHVAGKFNVKAVFDDRPSVVTQWNLMGLPNVIAVADQNIRF